VKDIDRLFDAIMHLRLGWFEDTDGGYDVSGYVVSVRHEPLLAQLGYAALIKGSGEPSLGGNPNKAATRPPGNTAPLNLLDRISSEARAMYAEALEMKGDNKSAVPVMSMGSVLCGLEQCAKVLMHEHPMHIGRMADGADSWVRAARLLLGYDVRSVMLADVSCHACGGFLSVPVDASGDVVCVGVPTDDPERQEQPCGVVYPQWQWPDMLAERQGVDLWTTREAVAYIVRECRAMTGATATRWLYNATQEGKIKNYGSPRKALWNSQEVLDQMARFVGA
jgi:hypothetical protein